MTNFNFICRQSKANKQGLAKIELSIIVNGKRTYLALNLAVKPDEFNKKMKSRSSNYIKSYCDSIRLQLNQALISLTASNKPITAEALKRILQCGSAYTLKDMCNDFYIKDNKYQLVIKDFLSFFSPNEPVESLNPALIQSYISHLYSTYKTSTAAGKAAKLKRIITYTINSGKLTSNPFNGIKIIKPKDFKIEYLTNNQLSLINYRNYHIPRLERVKDLFIFMCGSGLSYSDLQNLKREDIKESDGTFYIQKERVKTKITYTSVLLPFAVEILKKYNFELPLITNQKLNAYLKEIEDLSGVDQPLHCHLARKTYATLLINNGIRLDVVAKTLGHSNTRITSTIYAHLQTNTIINEVGKAFQLPTSKYLNLCFCSS